MLRCQEAIGLVDTGRAMSQENVEVVRRGYEAFAEGDLETVLGLLDSELISEEGEQTLDTPGTYYGPGDSWTWSLA